MVESLPGSFQVLEAFSPVDQVVPALIDATVYPGVD
jgi:hypothetical protein